MKVSSLVFFFFYALTTSSQPCDGFMGVNVGAARHLGLNMVLAPPDADSAKVGSLDDGFLTRFFSGEMDGNHAMRTKMETMLREAQISITKAIEDIDGEGKFREDSWVRDTGGGGHSRVLTGGKVWEKAGVNLSVVHGTMPVSALRAATERGVNRGEGEQVPFFACGLSCVMHPRNPHCPTMHFNYRCFETDDGEKWWFGGGTDLTPSYIDEEDLKHFHGTYKDVCDRHDDGSGYYKRFKKWADDYFLIQHRGERRGMGGDFL